MASNKRSARAKQRAAFEAGLEDGLSAGGMDDLFAREHAREERIDAEHDAALRHKACESKNRYASRPEAEAALISCEEHGRRGLSISAAHIATAGTSQATRKNDRSPAFHMLASRSRVRL